jgi:DNA-binding XRE family transcriptional regulator
MIHVESVQVSPPPRKKASAKKPAPKAKAADVDAIAFGQKLRAAREKAGMSQAELAKLAGVNQPAIPTLENGRTDVRLSTVRRFAKALGIPLKDLLPD